MKFLGVLLIITGIGVLFSWYILLGLIIIAVGIVCLRVGLDTKEKERVYAEQRETYNQIMNRTDFYIKQGMNPSDAKIKAEVDYKWKT